MNKHKLLLTFYLYVGDHDWVPSDSSVTCYKIDSSIFALSQVKLDFDLYKMCAFFSAPWLRGDERQVLEAALADIYW